MEAKELRIGNYVENDIGDFILIDRDTLPFIVTKWIKCHHPISLTEEWLVKFGFELKKVSMGGREYEGWRNFSFHLDTNYIKNTLFYHWMGGNIEIKHVHQLQNLYFALTNEELIIK
jgi:hypothetical protein